MFEDGAVLSGPAVLSDPAVLLRIPAGPDLAVALSALDTLPAASLSQVDGGAVVDALVGWGRLVAYAQARLLSAMVAVADRSVGVGFDADEVAFALHLPRVLAQREVALGQDLLHRLPAVFAALEAGRIDLARARVFSDQLAVVNDGLARSIAGKFLPAAEDWTASQLRSRLQREILAADPDAAGQRYERSVAERRVELTANPDTTAHLAGVFLPPQKAAAAFERVDALARGLKNDGDARTLDQLRADVFCNLLAGTLAPGGQQPVHRPGVVELQVPLATLTGRGDEPGVFAGYGPVIADIARQVAEQAAGSGSGYQWRFQVYDTDGTLLHNGVTRARPTGKPVPCPPAQRDETARFPSPALRRWITARDTTCRAPGCTAPARSCDHDHTADHAHGGKTRHDNLGLLCRHHHRLKHEGGFHLTQPKPGTFIWTSPTLKAYTTTDPDPPR